MSGRLVNDVKAHFESKSTDELLEIWQQNDRDTYSDAAFEAIRQILSERNETVTTQSVFVPKPPTEPQWGLHEIKKKRLFYLICFFLMFFGFIVMAFTDVVPILRQSAVGYITLIFGMVFLYFFLTSARKVFGYGIGDLVLIGIELFIPIIGALVFAIMDGRIYQAIKKRNIQTSPNFALLWYTL